MFTRNLDSNKFWVKTSLGENLRHFFSKQTAEKEGKEEFIKHHSQFNTNGDPWPSSQLFRCSFRQLNIHWRHGLKIVFYKNGPQPGMTSDLC